MKRRLHRKHGQNSLLVGAMLGLLSFMLAFTFGTTANRFDIRKGVLLEEVNSLGTAYLRADLLPDSHRVLNKDYLSEYVNLLVEAGQEKAPLPLIIEKLDRLEKELWQKNIELTRTGLAPQLLTFYLESLNDVFDLLTKRVTVSLRYHIPTNDLDYAFYHNMADNDGCRLRCRAIQRDQPVSWDSSGADLFLGYILNCRP